MSYLLLTTAMATGGTPTVNQVKLPTHSDCLDAGKDFVGQRGAVGFGDYMYSVVKIDGQISLKKEARCTKLSGD